MKTARLRYLGVLFLTLLSLWTPTKAQNPIDPLSSPVTLVINRASIFEILGILSHQTKASIGFEEVALDYKNEGKLVDLAIRKGVLKDALDAIVQADNRYEWAAINGVINVMPKKKEQRISETILVNFAINDIQIGDIGFAIIQAPEVKSRLIGLALKDSPFKEKADEEALRTRVSVSQVNVTVAEVLNGLLKARYIRYWAIVRYGDANEYIAILLY